MTQSIHESNRWDQEVVDGFRAFWKARDEVVQLGQSYRSRTQRDTIIRGAFLSMRAAAKRILAVADKASTEMAPVARLAEGILDAIPPRADVEALTEFFGGNLTGLTTEADHVCARWRSKQPSTGKPAQQRVPASTNLTAELLRVLVLIRDQGPITNDKIGEAWIAEYGRLGEDAVRKRWTGELAKRNCIYETRKGNRRGWLCTPDGLKSICAGEVSQQ